MCSLKNKKIHNINNQYTMSQSCNQFNQNMPRMCSVSELTKMYHHVFHAKLNITVNSNLKSNKNQSKAGRSGALSTQVRAQRFPKQNRHKCIVGLAHKYAPSPIDNNNKKQHQVYQAQHATGAQPNTKSANTKEHWTLTRKCVLSLLCRRHAKTKIKEIFKKKINFFLAALSPNLCIKPK